MLRVSVFLFVTAFLFSCSDKYAAFKNRYQFTSDSGLPDYNDLQYWAAHPDKWDPSDSIPLPLRMERRDSLADVFFIHPTSYTKHIKGDNAAIDDDYINAKTDYSSILYQASVFNGQCRVFAPRYRQASIKMFFIKDEKRRDASLKLAFEDVSKAFEMYMDHWNEGRPIIIAGHSQGSLMAEWLLKKYFEGKPLSRKLVAAYVIGWPLPKQYFTSLKMCEDSLETGCICSWRTLRTGYLPRILRNENGNSYVTNPLTWTTDSVYAPRELNEGSVLYKFNKVFKHTTDAQVSNGILYVKRPKFPGSFLYLTRNYHIGDINLFYFNLRENVRQRIRAFNSK